MKKKKQRKIAHRTGKNYRYGFKRKKIWIQMKEGRTQAAKKDLSKEKTEPKLMKIRARMDNNFLIGSATLPLSFLN